MYEYGTLRPPTEAEIREKYVPLEVIEVRWLTEDSWDVQQDRQKVGHGTARVDVYEPTMAELVNYTIQHEIPVGARVVYDECGSHRMALNWIEEN